MISPRTGIWIPKDLTQILNWWRAVVTGLHVLMSPDKEKARSA